jgi:hypothetical protein
VKRFFVVAFLMIFTTATAMAKPKAKPKKADWRENPWVQEYCQKRWDLSMSYKETQNSGAFIKGANEIYTLRQKAEHSADIEMTNSPIPNHWKDSDGIISREIFLTPTECCEIDTVRYEIATGEGWNKACTVNLDVPRVIIRILE